MNFLAHIYLSGNNKLLVVGNLIADAIKGRKYENLRPGIRKGVLMHRAIDDFTDRHPVNFNVRKLMHPVFGKYSGVYLDIFYDHFLAVGWNHFAENISLQMFCTNFYIHALRRHKHLPSKIRFLLLLFIISNRLTKYSKLSGIETTFEYMHKYSNLPRTGKEAVAFLKDNYDVLKSAFYEFFPHLVHYTRIWRVNDCNDLQMPDAFLRRYNESNPSGTAV